MKKFILGAVLLLCASIVLAGAPTSTRVPMGTNAFRAIPTSMAFPAAKTRFNQDIETINAGFLTNATTAIQYGTITNNGSITFSKAFSSTPSFVVTWQAAGNVNAGLITNAIAAFVYPSVATVRCDTVIATDMTWIAIGPCSP